MPTQNESWYGVSMLSSVLESDTAIEANRRIMRAFVMFHHLKTLPLSNAYDELKKEIEKVKDEMNEILADQNDINESTRAQLDAISTALAELQSLRSQIATLKKHRPIGLTSQGMIKIKILNLEIALECRSPVFVVLRTEGVNAEGLSYCAVLGAIVDEESFFG